MMAWSVRVSPIARGSLLALPDKAFLEISDAIELLRKMPYIGREYEPAYEAARLPFSCRVTYAGNYGIYYTPDEPCQEIYIRFVEDQRMNLTQRFTGRLGSS